MPKPSDGIFKFLYQLYPEHKKILEIVDIFLPCFRYNKGNDYSPEYLDELTKVVKNLIDSE
jgi:hypothetical protein